MRALRGVSGNEQVCICTDDNLIPLVLIMFVHRSDEDHPLSVNERSTLVIVCAKMVLPLVLLLLLLFNVTIIII